MSGFLDILLNSSNLSSPASTTKNDQISLKSVARRADFHERKQIITTPWVIKVVIGLFLQERIYNRSLRPN